MKIRTRFLVSYLALALVPLLAMSVTFIVVARRATSDLVRKELEGVARIQQKRLEYRMRQTYDRLAQVQSRTMLRQAMAEYKATPSAASLEEIESSLRGATASLADFRNMSVLDNNGNVIASTRDSDIGKNLSSSMPFKAGAGKPDISVFFRRPDGGLGEYLVGPMMLNGTKLGVLVIESSAEDLIDLVKDYTGLGRTGETIVAEETPEGTARFLGAPRSGRHEVLETVVPRTKSNIPINMALDRKTALVSGVDYRGEPVLAATGYIEDPPLGLATKIDRSEAFAPANSMIALVLLVLGLAVVAVLLVSWKLVATVTRPIEELTEVAAGVTAGDLTRRARVVHDDEIGALTRAFNQMTDELEAERAELERKVEERTAELERSNAELDGYAHTVSHDLRGPISSINLAATVLADTLEGSVSREDVEGMRALAAQIQASTVRSFSLIDDLLQLAEAGHAPASVAEIDLDEVVQKVKAELSDRIREKGARVVVEGSLGKVVANGTHMYLLFNNLAVNAIKHNDSPEPVVYIRRLESPDRQVHSFEVADNGPGILEEDRARVFEPFFKGAGGETGVGLATVRKVVESYGGSVNARPAAEGGASFTFEFKDFKAAGD